MSYLSDFISFVGIYQGELGLLLSFFGLLLSLILLIRVQNIKKSQEIERGRIIQSLNIPEQIKLISESLEFSRQIVKDNDSYTTKGIQINLERFQTMLKTSMRALQPYIEDEEFKKILQNNEFNEKHSEYEIIDWADALSKICNEIHNGCSELHIFAHSAKGYLEGIKSSLIKRSNNNDTPLVIKLLIRHPNVEGNLISYNLDMIKLGIQHINEIDTLASNIQLKTRYYFIQPHKFRFIDTGKNLYMSFYTFTKNVSSDDKNRDVRLTGRNFKTVVFSKTTPIGRHFNDFSRNIFDNIWEYRSFDKDEADAKSSKISSIRSIIAAHSNTKI